MHSIFYINWLFSKWRNSQQSFWATVESEFVAKNFQKSPNLVILIVSKANVRNSFSTKRCNLESNFLSPERRHLNIFIVSVDVDDDDGYETVFDVNRTMAATIYFAVNRIFIVFFGEIVKRLILISFF